MIRAPLVAAVAGALVLAAPASGAAPQYILVTGPCLAKPVLLGSWSENHVFLSALADAPRLERTATALVRRPRYRLALFWGPPAKQPPTRPRDAAQHGTFYPAHHGRPAVVDITEPRRASARALAVLARHGVPTRSAQCARG
jgi:hypothetical protein